MSTLTPSEELREAICDGAVDKIESLIHNGANVDFIDDESDWALVLWAVKANQVQALDLLLRHGANVHVADPSGNTALHKAAYLGHGECAKLLLLYGANLQTCNKMQQTPLELATLFDRLDMVTLLSQPLN